MRFDQLFTIATGGSKPYEYQEALANGEPESLLVDVPTGMGKTAAAVLAWLWNRVLHPDVTHRARWPRRLIYCLPMRILTVQTATAITQWLDRLLSAATALDLDHCQLDTLRHLASTGPSVLMGGQRPTDWEIYPELPAILVGTQDMLLSRALNRGYGMSRFRWPLNFGLLNNDCLWVMDEVQLMGPGLWTSGQLDWMRQSRFRTLIPTLTWWMSATQSSTFLSTVDRQGVHGPASLPFAIVDMPENLRMAKRPVSWWSAPALGKKAAKSIGGDPIPAFLAQLAQTIRERHRRGTLSLVVCNTVSTAQQLHTQLAGGTDAPLSLLTARMRPTERSARERQLIDFESKRKAGEAAAGPGLICVATQVVEAGLDISACQLWTEMAPWPSLIQRLGRLNRDGQSNATAQAFLFELPDGSSGKLRHPGPYDAAEVELARKLAGKLDNNLPAAAALAHLAVGSQDDVRRALSPPPAPLLRALDLHDLFSTEPDLFGGYTDVSPFLRGTGRDADAIVFWREFDPAIALPETLDGPGFDPAEGCSVPVGQLRQLLDKGRAHCWDDERGQWAACGAGEIFPGMTVMLPRRAGGYDVNQGWTGRASDRLVHVEAPGAFDDGNDGDATTESNHWVELQSHLDDVAGHAARIGAALELDPPLQCSLVTAAAYHDIGKALPQWQQELPQPAPRDHMQWAKAPYLFAVKTSPAVLSEGIEHQIESRLAAAGIGYRRGTVMGHPRLAGCLVWHTNRPVRDTAEGAWLTTIRQLPGVMHARMVAFRPGMRHEVASALALWHQYFRTSATFPALAIYLAAAHHGKVRTVLSSRRQKAAAGCANVCGVPVNSGSIPWEGESPLDFAAGTDGTAGHFSGDTFYPDSPGWTALVADLLGDWHASNGSVARLALRDGSEPAHLGPFTLGFLEALMMCADIRGGKEPSHVIPL